MTEVLQQLRDVHVPPAPAFWPPAPGWWLLWLVVLAVFAWSAVHWRRNTQRSEPFLAAATELDRIAALAASPAERAQQLALLLRRLQRALAGASIAAPLGTPLETLPSTLFGVAAPQLDAVLRQRFDPASSELADGALRAAIDELRQLLAKRRR